MLHWALAYWYFALLAACICYSTGHKVAAAVLGTYVFLQLVCSVAAVLGVGIPESKFIGLSKAPEDAGLKGAARRARLMLYRVVYHFGLVKRDMKTAIAVARPRVNQEGDADA